MGIKHIGDLHGGSCISDKARMLFAMVSESGIEKREEILKGIDMLREIGGLTCALQALYRQQVNSGYVFFDPSANHNSICEKRFFDPDTGIIFRLLWNPERELRRDHKELIKRGVIAKVVDETKLINKDEEGRGCYLCRGNIDIQNPKEVVLGIELAGEIFYVGANFACITDNHFTVMNAEHRPQQYRKEMPAIMNDFVDRTDGSFRAIFNGMAGASILEHEHLQATTEEFPIERIKIGGEDLFYEGNKVSILRPRYYVPVWIVEGIDKIGVNLTVDRIIREWHRLDQQYYTVNIISTKMQDRNLFRTFIILRDKRRLVGPWKRSAMASFEAGGCIVLSCKSGAKEGLEIDEGYIFNNATIEMMKEMLIGISPDEEGCSRLSKRLRCA